MNPQLKSVMLGSILSLAMAPAIAQSSDGNLVGEATTGDTVIVQGNDSGFHREIEIKQDGKYMLRRVPAGSYTVEIKDQDGNADLVRSVIVQAGRTTRVQ